MIFILITAIDIDIKKSLIQVYTLNETSYNWDQEIIKLSEYCKENAGKSSFVEKNFTTVNNSTIEINNPQISKPALLPEIITNKTLLINNLIALNKTNLTEIKQFSNDLSKILIVPTTKAAATPLTLVTPLTPKIEEKIPESPKKIEKQIITVIPVSIPIPVQNIQLTKPVPNQIQEKDSFLKPNVKDIKQLIG